MPELVKGSDSFTFPNNQFGDQGYGSLFVTDSVYVSLTQESGYLGRTLYGTSGFNSTKYLFGSGTISLQAEDGSETTYVSDGFVQSYDKPMSPLYVESIWIPGVTYSVNANSADPLPEGKTLTMQVISDVDGHVIATLTAGKEDLEQNQKANGQELGTVTFYNLTFSMKEGKSVVPFVINEPFSVKVTGYSQSGVELGCSGYEQVEEDPLTEGVFVLNGEGAPTDVAYQGKLRAPIYFTGMLENVYVPSSLTLTDGSTLEGTNVLRVADDGSGVTIDGSEVAGGVVYTAADWYDVTKSTEYYGYRLVKSSTGDGSWIQGMTCDDSNYKQLQSDADGDYYTYTGQNIINFTTDPISAGQGRWAVLEIVSFRDYSENGFAPATNRIVLLQGNATLSQVDVPTTGIKGVNVDNDKKFDANAPVYNLNGQRVSKDTKGILIQNGKKFINK